MKNTLYKNLTYIVVRTDRSFCDFLIIPHETIKIYKICDRTKKPVTSLKSYL